LERHLPTAPARRAIVHGDVRNGNIIIGPDALCALLDWEAAKRNGDPMENLACASQAEPSIPRPFTGGRC
jgi:aminoglycoside phosphotransferase (APT) family kinase protein